MNIDPSTVIEQSTKPHYSDKKRFRLLAGFVIFSLAVIISRGFYLQIIQGSSFRSRAENNRVNTIIAPAPRGVIYDRNGVQLVENISSTDLVFDPVLLPKEDDESYLIEQLTELLPDVSTKETLSALQRARKLQQPTLVAKALDHDIVLKLQEKEEDIQGTRLVSALVRKYLYAYSLAHILGYASAVTADDLEKYSTLYPTDTTGKAGIEKEYDRALRGTYGISYTEVNASGKQQTNLGAVEATPGQDIQLTIDIELQEFIYGLFSELEQRKQEEGIEQTAGSAIVLHPVSGEVLAMVSYPSYDPNVFSQPSLSSYSSSILTDPSNPLFHRALGGTYPPGSTIKPFLAAAALEENIITPRTTFLSTGGISIGPWYFADWKAGGHGLTDVKKAISESVNTFFYNISGGNSDFNGLGIHTIMKYLKYFGWSEPTGIDLPSEASGFLPSPTWKQEQKGEPWYIGDTYNLGIGQGDVLVTPLQVAVSTSALARRGYMNQPYVVRSSKKPQKVPVSLRHIDTVREGMRQAVTDGSARGLSLLPIPIAGKTGTAQVGGTEQTHAWFTSFGPYKEPELVVTVLLEKGGGGDTDAVPFAKEIWQWWSENQR